MYFCKMSKILAIDFGLKKSGIAVTDDLKIIASGLSTVETSKLLEFLTDYFKNNMVETIVIGLPKKLDNSLHNFEEDIQLFIKRFHELYPNIAVERIDERFTSKLAFQTMIDSGLKKKDRQNKHLIDEISATIILQSYLYK